MCVYIRDRSDNMPPTRPFVYTSNMGLQQPGVLIEHQRQCQLQVAGRGLEYRFRVVGRHPAYRRYARVSKEGGERSVPRG